MERESILKLLDYYQEIFAVDSNGDIYVKGQVIACDKDVAYQFELMLKKNGLLSSYTPKLADAPSKFNPTIQIKKEVEICSTCKREKDKGQKCWYCGC